MRSPLGPPAAPPCRGGGGRIRPASDQRRLAGRRVGDGKDRLVAPNARAAGRKAPFRARPACDVGRSSEIRRCRRHPRRHAPCAGGCRRVCGALAGLPVRCPGIPNVGGDPGIPGGAGRSSGEGERGVRREPAGPGRAPCSTGSRRGR